MDTIERSQALKHVKHHPSIDYMIRTTQQHHVHLAQLTYGGGSCQQVKNTNLLATAGQRPGKTVDLLVAHRIVGIANLQQ